MKQRIIIEIDTQSDKPGEDLPPYELMEKKGTGEYEALRHFFEDIGYTVTKLEIREKVLQSATLKEIEDLVVHTDKLDRSVVVMIPAYAQECQEIHLSPGMALTLSRDLVSHVNYLDATVPERDEGAELIEETFKNQERPSVVLGRSAALGNVLQATAVMRERCEQALKEYGADGDPEAVESMKSLIKHFNKLEATIRRKM